MPRRFDKYRVKDGVTRLGAAFLNLVFGDLDLRLATLEDLQISWDEAVRTVNEQGLRRLDEVINPSLIEAIAKTGEIEDKRVVAIAALATLQELVDSIEATADADITAWKNGHLAEIASLVAHAALTNNPHTVTAAQVGLGNVTNALQLVKANNLSDLANAATARINLGLGNLSNALQLIAANNLSDLVNAATARGNLGLGSVATLTSDTDGTLAANSDTRVATQKATKTYVDGIIAAQDAMVFKGLIDCSANPNYPAADRGNTYRASVAGKIGGAAGLAVEVGDIIICLTDGTAAGAHAAVGANWGIIQVNIDGAVTTAGFTMAGDIGMGNHKLSGIKTATFNSQGNIATTTGAITVDWTTGQCQKQAEPTGAITYTFTAPDGPCHLQLLIDSDGASTAQTITWPATVKWINAQWSAIANKAAMINFWYDGASYWAMGANQA